MRGRKNARNQRPSFHTITSEVKVMSTRQYCGCDNRESELGEWTVELIEGIHRAAGSDEEFYSDIADAHNAALAAEREKWNDWHKFTDEGLTEYVGKQLAAERDKLVTGLHRLYALRDPTCQEQAERAYNSALSQ